ncbi:endothelin-converting enzyme homolog [Mizuhopecten yessoensis]|uniref:endothelin-converting enzyme homolog n=1 Tax=Mizuhopecten yessoensis TaxID=6573 RepID=UPI000B45B543|nr:endothelin-converting enzyme homolog [Mizuhopecten yessoensis]
MKTGVNLPAPPAQTLLHVSNQPLDFQVLSGSQASSGSGGTPASVEVILPHSSIANQAFNFPITATSEKVQGGSSPASSGLQNDMLISIAELSGKLINSQPGLVEPNGSIKVTTGICVTPDCIRAATEIKASRDLTANPCEDFYQYTCGGWLDNSPIRPDQHSRSIKWDVMESVDEKLHKLLNQSVEVKHTQAEQKAITFYKSCINEDAIETLGLTVIKPLLNDLGGWPLLELNVAGRHFKLESVLSTARKYTVDTPIFVMAIETDPTFPEQNIIHIEQPHLGMPDRTYYLTDNKVYSAYVNNMLEVVKALGADPLTAAQDVKDVINFETKLANLTQEVDQNQDPSPDRRMTIDQLMQTFPGLDWKQYIYNIFSSDQVRIPIHSNDLVLISNPEYIRDVIGLLRNTSARVAANYINWMMVQSLILSLPANIRQLHQSYTKMVPEAKGDLPRWQQCVEATNKVLGLAVARLFVDKHFDSASKQEVLDMFAKTKSSMRSMLERESWMDLATKTAALEKLDALQARIGYPEEIKDIAYLNKRYNRVSVTPDLFFQNNLNIMKDEAVDNLRDMAMPSNLTEWESPPPAAKDILYELDHNVIVLPAGVLQSPYFHKDYPRYLNYGAIGFIIGHKITHAFDDVGSRYSKTGKFEDWWSNYTRNAYGQKAECFIKQYDGLTVTDALSAATLPEDSKLNGKLTLQENIADNGGLKESFTAYTQWAKQHGLEQKLPGLNLEPDQLFFVNYGRTWCGKTTPQEAIRRIQTDIWADAKNRINTVVQNNPSFSKAFSCPVGSPMNPAKKCAVW